MRGIGREEASRLRHLSKEAHSVHWVAVLHAEVYVHFLRDEVPGLQYGVCVPHGGQLRLLAESVGSRRVRRVLSARTDGIHGVEWCAEELGRVSALSPTPTDGNTSTKDI